MIETAGEILEQARECGKDLKELIDNGALRLASIGEYRSCMGLEPLASQIGDAVEQIEHDHSKGGTISGIETGLSNLDDMTCGLQNGDLILLASAPSVGKTSLALTVACNAAREAGIGVAIFSPGISRMELVKRLLAAESRVDLHRICTGRLRDDQFIQLRAPPNVWLEHLSILTTPPESR